MILPTEGDVRFEGDVTIKGTVRVKNSQTSQMVIKHGTVFDHDLML